MNDQLGRMVAAWLEGDEAFVANPWPLFSRLRNEAPVFEQDNIVLVKGYADVLSLFQEPRMSAHKRDNDLVASQLASLSGQDAVLAREWLGFQKMILGMTDPPDHTRRRTLQIQGFIPRQLNLVEKYIGSTVDRLLDE